MEDDDINRTMAGSRRAAEYGRLILTEISRTFIEFRVCIINHIGMKQLNAIILSCLHCNGGWNLMHV